MTTTWPEKAPILEASDFCRGTFHTGTRSCLMGHVQNFVGWQDDKYHKVNDAIVSVLRKRGWRGDFVADFSDNKRNSLSLLAKVWNKAMARLGYTDGNPETP